MRYIAVFARHVALCTLFAVLSGAISLSIESLICKGISGNESAGGGSAVGMIALAVSTGTFLLMIVTTLGIYVVRTIGVWKLSFSTKREVAIYVSLCAIVLVSLSWLLYAKGC